MYQKSHICIKCNQTLRLDKVHLLFDSDKIAEAQAYLQELKKQDALKKGDGEFTSADKLFATEKLRKSEIH